ncbi:uncharacterized protein [Trachinotus anak]|uniref:uncharacterized protein n=1 Tax=Trachinotus anak TaxID=443729 RepID=UPI0039F1C9B5
MATVSNEKNRRIIYCLICKRPQEMLPTHLARVCMKDKGPGERSRELQRAKASMKDWTRQGRIWDYAEMCERYPDTPTRLALLEDLRQRHFFIFNDPEENRPTEKPPTTSDAAVQTHLPAIKEEVSSDFEEGPSPSSVDDAGPSDPTWRKDTAQNRPSVRVNMQQMGLYEKFPDEAEILTNFKKYLTDTLRVPNCQQEVDNVSRVLRFIQPSGNEVSVDFVLKSTETKDFFNRLKTAKMCPSTITNYVKRMTRFVQYIGTLDLPKTEPDFHRKCQAYIELLGALRKTVAKAVSKATFKKRYGLCSVSKLTLHDCQQVFREAKRDMLDIQQKLLENQHVGVEEKTLFRYYCEAILVLKHFQRPGVVGCLTAEQWVNNTRVSGRVCVEVSGPKMDTATFALSEEEAAMMDAYFQSIRPECLQDKGDQDGGKFFLSKTGAPIHNATCDLERLHEHYKLPHITSKDVRRAAETEARERFSEEQKAAAACYMARSTTVGDTQRRALDSVVATANLLGNLAPSSTDRSQDERGSQAQKRARDAVEQEHRDFSAFLQDFPVTETGKPPTKKQRVDAGFPPDRVFYDRWRAVQFGKREQYLLSKSSRHPPTVQKVAKIIRGEGWTANYPRPEDIVARWQPPRKLQVESDPDIINRVTNQRWSGLAVKYFGDKGQGVVSTKPFAKGSVVCDYHGKVITAAEGRKMMEALPDEISRLFFFKTGGRDLCIDAQTFPCECHPAKDTIGRRINRSEGRHPVPGH